MEKISNEERVRIFAAYWGAEVKIRASGVNTYPMVQLNKFAICVGKNKLKVDMWYKISHFVLVLKPLSEITDADVDYLTIEMGYSIRMIEAFRDNSLAYSVHLPTAVECIDYLRSKGYNVGYGMHTPQDLIDTGIVEN